MTPQHPNSDELLVFARQERERAVKLRQEMHRQREWSQRLRRETRELHIRLIARKIASAAERNLCRGE